MNGELIYLFSALALGILLFVARKIISNGTVKIKDCQELRKDIYDKMSDSDKLITKIDIKIEKTTSRLEDTATKLEGVNEKLWELVKNKK